MLKRQYSIRLLFIAICFSFVLTGCWDKLESEERVYAMTIGIDAHEGDEEEGSLLVSFAMPNPAAVRGESDEYNVVIKGPGDSMYSVMRRMGTRTSKEIYLGHLREVLISEDVAKDPKLVREIFDALEKDPHISRKVYLGIVEGKAKEVLTIEPSLDPYISRYIRNIFEWSAYTNRAPLQDLDRIFYSFHRSGNGAITRVIPGEEDIKVAGAAIFKDFQFIGWIGEEINIGLMFLKDETELGGFDIEYMEKTIPIEITESKTKYDLIENGDEFKIIVNVTWEGDIKQHFFNPEEKILSTDLLGELHTLVCIEIEEKMRATLNVLQNEYMVDVIEFDDYLHKFHPGLWNRIKNDYDDIFPQMDIVINVDGNIRRVGLSK